ncbi:MAG: N-6 DNA methylase [Rhodospirillales bacterium]|nr:N-6 DNA methylase [Rhodospirillales bacterium]
MQQNFPIRTGETAFLFLQHFIKTLKAGGRAGIVIKDTFLSTWFRRHEDIIQRTVNLLVFIFIVTSVVYVTQHVVNPQISTYIDALYFTITTLTTTGFGDITLRGPAGRLLAVVIMFVGVELFLRLLQAIFRPSKVRFECPDCGLMAHDAVHCKHCGRVVHIRDEGAV